VIRARIIRNLTVFACVVLSIGFVGRAIDVAAGTEAGQEGPGILLWLVVPPIVAVLLRAFAGDGWKDFGIRPHLRANARWYLVALVAFPVVTVVAVAIGAALGLAQTPSLSSALFTTIVQAFAISLAPQLLKNVFEETAWRGYLAPRVYALGLTGMRGHVLVGAIWGAWHVPYYLYYLDRTVVARFTTLPLAMFIMLAIATMMAWAVVYGELYLLTRSIWPAVLMHAVEDAFLNQLFIERHLVISPRADWLVSPVNGVAGIILFLCLGIALNRYRRRQESAGKAAMDGERPGYDGLRLATS
jgi:membrane protease YdiL (CAAX protease family)